MELEQGSDGGKVYIVDDDDSFRAGLARALNASGLHAVGYRCAGEYLLAEPCDTPGCIVLDLCMPGPNGMELLDALTARESAPPVIFVTACGEVATSVHAMKSGAVDFLTKPVPTAKLLHSVRSAIALDTVRRAERAQLRTLHARYKTLSEREREVFIGVANGKLHKQLAAEINTCERTIKAYRARAMRKLRVNSLANLVRVAKLLGVVHGTQLQSRLLHH